MFSSLGRFRVPFSLLEELTMMEEDGGGEEEAGELSFRFLEVGSMI